MSRKHSEYGHGIIFIVGLKKIWRMFSNPRGFLRTSAGDQL
jgi:hypothetical protein